MNDVCSNVLIYFIKIFKVRSSFSSYNTNILIVGVKDINNYSSSLIIKLSIWNVLPNSFYCCNIFNFNYSVINFFDNNFSYFLFIILFIIASVFKFSVAEFYCYFSFSCSSFFSIFFFFFFLLLKKNEDEGCVTSYLEANFFTEDEAKHDWRHRT